MFLYRVNTLNDIYKHRGQGKIFNSLCTQHVSSTAFDHIFTQAHSVYSGLSKHNPKASLSFKDKLLM